MSKDRRNNQWIYWSMQYKQWYERTPVINMIHNKPGWITNAPPVLHTHLVLLDWVVDLMDVQLPVVCHLLSEGPVNQVSFCEIWVLRVDIGKFHSHQIFYLHKRGRQVSRNLMKIHLFLYQPLHILTGLFYIYLLNNIMTVARTFHLYNWGQNYV